MGVLKRIAVDIGGTFTDIISIDKESLEIAADKAPTTPKDLCEGVVAAVKKIQPNLNDVEIFIHGSTVATNALLQKRGARTGLITTRGFRDVLEIRRINRPDDRIYDILWRKPEPLVPRYLRLEVSARTTFNGEIIREVRRDEVEQIVNRFKETGVESIAVCLLHSYARPEHEEQIREIIQEIWPEVFVSVSHEVAREIREYERTSTTVIDAYIKKPVVSYLKQLKVALRDNLGLSGDLFITSSVGGASTVDVVEKAPIQMISSGPAGGAIGAAYLSEVVGIGNLLAADVGGTSYDVSLVDGGRNKLRPEVEVLGYSVRQPSIDVRSVGAGGGSIAYVDEGGLLHVGPESAGADPGPMCYGKGGERPTVTDAALVVGLLDPERFAGGELKLNPDLAVRGIEPIAKRLGMGLHETAEGILTVARNKMGDIVRQILVGEGYDPRDFTMVSFGGGGGLFAVGVAEALDISRVIIPPYPAVFCAWGMLAADIVQTFSRSYVCSTEALSAQVLNEMYVEMEEAARVLLGRARIPDSEMVFLRSVDARYEGQGHEVEVPLPSGRFDETIKGYIARRFDEVHEAKYGHRMETERETVTFRLRAIGKMEGVPIKEIPGGNNNSDHALKARRRVFLGGGLIDCGIYDRSELLSGNVVAGPAIVEEPTHVTVVMPGQELRVDRYGNLVIKIGG